MFSTTGRDSKWPNDLNALRSIITEFYFEIAVLLKQNFNMLAKVKSNHIDILYEGVLFRLRLYQPKEILLLKKHTNEEGTTSYKETVESTELEKTLHIIPSLIGALNGYNFAFRSYLKKI